MLLDSNIVIYATDSSHDKLLEWLDDKPLAACSVTRIEVLGYHGLNPEEADEIGNFLAGITVYPLSDAIVDRSIALRRARKMPLPDAIIAATALENDIPLVTRNTKDFRKIPNLELVNPFDDM